MDLQTLQLIADHSSEHGGTPADTITRAGFPATLRALQREGLVEVIEEDGEPTVVVTSAGWDVLRPQNSL